MRIPDGAAFGQGVAQNPQGPRVSAGQLDGGLARAVGGLGAALGGAADVLGAEAARASAEQRLVVEKAQGAQAALVLAQTTNDLHDAHDEVARGVAGGGIDPAKAGVEFEARVDKLRSEERFSGLDDARRAGLESHIVATTGALTRSLGGVVLKRQQSDTAATIDAFGEAQQREVLRSGPAAAAGAFDKMVDGTAGGAGWSPEVAARKKQAFREQAHATFFGAEASKAFQAGDMAALDALRTRIAGPEGESLDPARRVALENQAFGYRNQLQAQQDRSDARIAREAQAREKLATDTIGRFTTLIESGQYASKDAIDQLTQATAGTQFAGYARELLAQQSAVAGFASRSAAERQAILNEARARGADPARGTSPEGAKSVAALEKIDAAARAAVADDPWQAAQKYGVIRDAGLLSVADVPSALGTLQARMATIGQVEAWTGGKVSPLRPQETEALSRVLRALPPDQAASAFGQVGAVLGDQQRVAALARQVGDKDGTMALAMGYGLSGTSYGRATAELVLRGERAIKDKLVTPDVQREAGWQASIAKAINGAFPNPQVEEQAKRAAYLILAAKAAEGDANIDAAVKLATGGIVERNGQKIPLPYGMQTAEDFEKRLGAVTAADLAPQAPGGKVRAGAAELTVEQFVEQLPKATLVHAGQGLYAVRAGTSLVTNAAGRPVVIRVQP